MIDEGILFGTEFTQEEIMLKGANFETFNYEDLINKTAELLTNEKAIGW